MVVLLSCIITRRRRDASHSARMAPSIMHSRPWERRFTVKGGALNKHRRARDVFMQNHMRNLNDMQFLQWYKVRKSTFN